jgi:hypothetical protein
VQRLDAQADVRVARRAGAAQQVALREHRRELAGERAEAEARALDHHVGEPRVRAEAGHAPAVRREVAVGGERAELAQQLAGLGERRRGRRIEQPERGRIGHAPGGEVERERREVGLEDLGRRGRLEAALVLQAPQPQAQARPEPAGAAAALVGGGTRDARGDEAAHAGERLEARTAREARVHDDAHALDGERGLGDRGGEHHLAPARRRGRERRVLLGGRQVAEQRVHGDTRRQCASSSSRATRRISGAPGRNTSTSPVGSSSARRIARADVAREGGRLRARQVARLDGKGAALGGDHRRVAQQPRDGARIERGRHHQQAQVVAQVRLHVEREREPEVGHEAALVELVEDDEADVLERGVGLQHAGEHALGDDGQARVAGNLRLEPRAVADAPADGLAEQRAMRVATARAASRRGSSIRMPRPPSHAASSSASGTAVLLPAPGGAVSTADRACASACAIPGRCGAIGSSARAAGNGIVTIGSRDSGAVQYRAAPGPTTRHREPARRLSRPTRTPVRRLDSRAPPALAGPSGRPHLPQSGKGDANFFPASGDRWPCRSRKKFASPFPGKELASPFSLFRWGWT